MNDKRWWLRGLAVVLGLTVAAQLWAFPAASRKTKSACASCHASPAGGAELTEGGKAWKASGKAPPPAKASVYVGSDKCKSCHITQHNAWAETPHASALANLRNAPADSVKAVAAKLKIKLTAAAAATDACVQCHVTGFQLNGGYPAADSARTAGVSMVGCESCHGPGSQHVTALMADRKKTIDRGTEATCLQCHTKVMSPTFKFEEWVKRGVHPIKTEG